MKKIKLLRIIIIIVLLVAFLLGLFILRNSQNDKILRELIKSYVLANASDSVEDVIVYEVVKVVDNQGVEWIWFQLDPLPKDVTDSAYGFMRKSENGWVGVGFGTFAVEMDLPEEVWAKFEATID